MGDFDFIIIDLFSTKDNGSQNILVFSQCEKGLNIGFHNIFNSEKTNKENNANEDFLPLLDNNLEKNHL